MLLSRKRRLARTGVPKYNIVPLKKQQEYLDSFIKTHHNQHRGPRGDRENLKWTGVSGSLTSATVEVNFDPLKLRRLLSCGVQSALSFYVKLCIVGKRMEFPDLNINISILRL